MMTDKSPHVVSSPPSNPHYIVYSLLSGGIAGSAAKTFTAPLDRVKILFQASNPIFLPYRENVSGPFKAIGWIVRNEGILALYKGHSATLARIFPYAAINFMCYEQYKKLLNSVYFKHFNEKNSNSNAADLPVLRLFAGSLAGISSVFCTYPLDYVHSRITYQIHQTKYRSISQTIKETIKEGRIEQAHNNLTISNNNNNQRFPGFRALYRGFVPTMLGIIPYAGVSFFTYDLLKQFANSYNLNSVGWKLLCGAIAGAAAQTAAYPFDVIRRRMQLVGLASNLSSTNYNSLLQATKSIISESGGFRGLYIGLSINYMKVGPAHAISFVTYEYAKKLFGIHNSTKQH